jgi:hypothetical protein
MSRFVTVATGPACFIANKPRSMPLRRSCTNPDCVDEKGRLLGSAKLHRHCPTHECTLRLTSKTGKALPLRAIPWRELNRHYWSEGKVLNEHLLERSEPRELTAFEKTADPSTMTLEELIATQHSEPISESRRSWLTRGAGALALNFGNYEDGTIGATLADTSAAAALEMTLAENEDEADAIKDDANDRRYGAAYVTVDPITAKQIEWEQEQAMNGPLTRVKLVSKDANGGPLVIRPDRKLMPDEFLALAKSVKRSLTTTFGAIAPFNAMETLDDLHARVDLIREAMDASGVTVDFGSADPTEERERFLAPADPEWHSAYERPHAMIAWDPSRPVELEEWFSCTRRSCTNAYVHKHVRVAQPVHRGPRSDGNWGTLDETWRTRIFDPTAFELGTDGLFDPLVTDHPVPLDHGFALSMP